MVACFLLHAAIKSAWTSCFLTRFLSSGDKVNLCLISHFVGCSYWGFLPCAVVP